MSWNARIVELRFSLFHVISKNLFCLCLCLFFSAGCASIDPKLWQTRPNEIIVNYELRAKGDRLGSVKIYVPKGTYTFLKEVPLGYLYTCESAKLRREENVFNILVQKEFIGGIILSNRSDDVIPAFIYRSISDFPTTGGSSRMGELPRYFIEKEIDQYGMATGGCALPLNDGQRDAIGLPRHKDGKSDSEKPANIFSKKDETDPKSSNIYNARLATLKDHYPFTRWAQSGRSRFTPKVCSKFSAIFDHLIKQMEELGEHATDQEKLEPFHQAVLALNTINSKDLSLIDNEERHDLCQLFNDVAIAAGLLPANYGDGKGPADEWREW